MDQDPILVEMSKKIITYFLRNTLICTYARAHTHIKTINRKITGFLVIIFEFVIFVFIFAVINMNFFFVRLFLLEFQQS